MTPAEQLYGAGSPTSHLACQPGIHRAPTKRRFLAVVGASRACPTASVSCWRTLQRVAPRVGDLATAAGLSPGQLYFNIERVGNASSASIPLAIHDAVRDRVITRPTRVNAVAGSSCPGWNSGCPRRAGLPRHRRLRIEKLLHQAGHNRRRTGLLQIVSGLDGDKAGVADARRK
jgi:hypothetical protein